MNFKDQYKHPLWQKKRLESLNAAEYRCERCYDDAAQLHVHHKRYIKDRMIWEYEINELVALCSSCHELVHIEKELLSSLIARIDVMAIEEIIGLLAGFCSEVKGPASTDVTGHLTFCCDSLGVKAGIEAAKFINNFVKGQKNG